MILVLDNVKQIAYLYIERGKNAVGILHLKLYGSSLLELWKIDSSAQKAGFSYAYIPALVRSHCICSQFHFRY